VQRARLTHLLENRLPGVVEIDVRPADVPVVGVLEALVRMVGKIELERFESGG
jgi:hypothetical protein